MLLIMCRRGKQAGAGVWDEEGILSPCVQKFILEEWGWVASLLVVVAHLLGNNMNFSQLHSTAYGLIPPPRIAGVALPGMFSTPYFDSAFSKCTATCCACPAPVAVAVGRGIGGRGRERRRQIAINQGRGRSEEPTIKDLRVRTEGGGWSKS